MANQKWSQDVTEHSNALDLEKGIFESHDPEKIAQSLKRSTEHSERRRASPFRSAMSMLTYFINRAGNTLSPSQKRVLAHAKSELRKTFGRSDG
jgi:hypothetical protein